MNNKKKALGKKYERELRENQTPAERMFKKLLRQVKKEYDLKFECKFQKGWYEDEAFYISDFYFPRSKMTVELDGMQHSNPHQMRKDERKSRHLRALGIGTIRLKNQMVYDMNSDKMMDFLIKNRVI